MIVEKSPLRSESHFAAQSVLRPDLNSYNSCGMNKSRIALVLVALFFCLITLRAEDFHVRLSPTQKQHLLDGPFTKVTKIEAMPASVKQAFARITGEPAFALANPGEKFQVTDVIIDRSLPHRRLVFAGVRDDEWFVHYEVGGIGRSYCVVLFRVDSQNHLTFVWGGAGSQGAKDFDQLRKMVAGGQFSDDRNYYW